MYFVVSKVKKKIKALGKRCSPGFLAELDVYLEKKLVEFAKNSGGMKTLRREDILTKIQ